MEKDQEPTLPFFLKLCSDRAAFEAKLRRRIRFNMDEVKRLFEATSGYSIVVHTPYIVVLRSSTGTEVTFSKNGRMLIKRVSDENEAKVVAHEVLQIALRESTAPRGPKL